MRVKQYHSLCCLLACLCSSLSKKTVVVEAQERNPFLRTMQTDYTAVTGDQQQQDDDCPGINTISDFPFITGGTTFLEEEVDSEMPSLTILAESSMQDENLLDAPGVWYRFHGKNKVLRASLSIANKTNQTIALFQGSTCQLTECISITNHLTDYNQLNWFAEEGATYFFKVFGASADQSGPFVLEMEVRRRHWQKV
jgi:hypothetical protein